MFGVHPWQVAGGSAASRALSPTPSRSLQFQVPRSPLRRLQPPVGCRASWGSSPPVRKATPAPSPSQVWASSFSVLIYGTSSENVQWMKTDLGVKLKKHVCAILYRGGGICRLCCHQPGFASVPEVPTISWGRSIPASASSGEIKPGEGTTRGKAVAAFSKSPHWTQLQSRHAVDLSHVK